MEGNEIVDDNAQKISAQVWKWYKKYSKATMTDDLWEKAIAEGEEIVGMYLNDNSPKYDYEFATRMFLLFLDRVERMNKN